MDLHRWAFDLFTTMLDYKAEAEGIEVTQRSERDILKSRSVCGRANDSQRVERGCTFLRSAIWSPMPTRTARRTSDKRYSQRTIISQLRSGNPVVYDRKDVICLTSVVRTTI